MTEIKFMPDKRYFALEAVDQSLLKKFMESPLKYITAKETDTESPAMIFGSLVHAKVLGSGAEYAIRPNRSTKVGKAKAKELEDAGKILVAENDLSTAEAMATVTKPYFDTIPGQPEMALLASDMYTNIPLKAKVDWLPTAPDSDGVYRIRDYKTTASSPTDFAYTAFKYGYHIQAAFYMMMAHLCGIDETLGFEFVVQEKTAPYDYMVWRFDENSVEVNIANKRIASALNDLSAYLKMGDPVASMKANGLNKVPQIVEFSDWQLAAEDDDSIDMFGTDF